MATVERKQKRTLLTSMEDVIAKAKEQSLTPEFYKAAAASLKYISSTLELSKEEALLLSLFFEKSSSNRIWINNLADLLSSIVGFYLKPLISSLLYSFFYLDYFNSCSIVYIYFTALR